MLIFGLINMAIQLGTEQQWGQNHPVRTLLASEGRLSSQEGVSYFTLAQSEGKALIFIFRHLENWMQKAALLSQPVVF